MTAKNPFNDLLEETQDDPATIQQRYHLHRTNRNAAQKEKLLSPDFKAFSLDEVLMKLEDPATYPSFRDPRYCFVFWARPAQHVIDLGNAVQAKLKAAFPNMWVMPSDCMHTTSIEITHSRTEEEIDAITASIKESIPIIAKYAYDKRPRLVKPCLGFDAQAIALTYLPANGESLGERKAEEDDYTYHHFRRDLFDACENAGASVQSRYVALSAHLTMGRFINEKDFRGEDGELDPKKVEKLIAVIEEINEWLEQEYWPKDGEKIKGGGEWIVGQERGLDARCGTLWYGGGRTLHLGPGF